MASGQRTQRWHFGDAAFHKLEAGGSYQKGNGNTLRHINGLEGPVLDEG